MGPEFFSKMIALEGKSKVLLDLMIFFDEIFEWRFKVGCAEEIDEVLFWEILELVSNLEMVLRWEQGMKVSEQDDFNEEEVFSFENKV